MELAFTDPDLTLEGVAEDEPDAPPHRHAARRAVRGRGHPVGARPHRCPRSASRDRSRPSSQGKDIGPAAPALFTAPFNLSGNPVVSVPTGLVEGVPVGMQIIARRHEDGLAMQVAARYEQARPWPKLATGY